MYDPDFLRVNIVAENANPCSQQASFLAQLLKQS